MERIGGQPILSAAQMRDAEARAAPDSGSLYELMERAGRGVAEAVRRIAAGSDILVACGPGNNGGDGYVAARILRESGMRVRLAAMAPPATELGRMAADRWTGPVEPMEDAAPAPILVDALFGTGISRHIDHETMWWFTQTGERARFRVAVDLPSGMDSDTGAWWHRMDRPSPSPHLTLALGALKPAHTLPSASGTCGEIRVIDLGLDLARWPVRTNHRPDPPPLTADIHKYLRGMIGIIAGEMPGAAMLAATAAARAGAGYVVVFGEAPRALNAIVHRPLTQDNLSDERLSAVVVGPGLGRGATARRWVEFLLTETRVPLVIDADALHLVERSWLADRRDGVVLTPHHGEHGALMKRFGANVTECSSAIERTIAETAALAPGAPLVMVEKGSTTYVIGWNGVRVEPRTNPWLSTAGTGDVLAGAIGTMLGLYANFGQSTLDAAAAGVWLHAEAARRLGSAFVADDLADELSRTRALL